MLHAIDPLALVLAPVRVRVHAMPMLLIKLVVSLILAPILPHVVPVAVHHSVLEAALEVATVAPLEAAVPAHLIIAPLARVLGPIRPVVHSLALLNAVLKVTMVVAAIAPHLNALAILLVMGRHFRGFIQSLKVVLDVEADVLSEDAKVRLAVLLPEALIDFIGVRCTEHAQTTGLSIDPVALEGAPIGPN